MKIFVNRSQESLEKNSWVPIAMLWSQIMKKKVELRPRDQLGLDAQAKGDLQKPQSLLRLLSTLDKLHLKTNHGT
jgi:hypothetical protein